MVMLLMLTELQLRVMLVDLAPRVGWRWMPMLLLASGLILSWVPRMLMRP